MVSSKRLLWIADSTSGILINPDINTHVAALNKTLMSCTMRVPAAQLRRLTTAMSKEEAAIPFMEPMHVLGSGSIGLLFASYIRMGFPSFPLTMLLRPPHEPRLQSLDKSKRRQYMEVCIQRDGRPCMVHLPAEIIGSDLRRNVRNLMLATKAPDAAKAVVSIVDRLDENARIILLCNGALAVQEDVNDVLRDASMSGGVQIYLASTTHGAYRDSNDKDSELYHVVHAGIGKTYIEEFSSMARLWDQAGLVAKSISKQEMNTLLWHKLAANCVINPLTALLHCENGQLLEKDLYQNMAEPILEELANVAQQSAERNGQQLDELSIPELLSFVQDVIADTAHNKSSMLQDVMRRRPTEIQYLNGYVVRKGVEYGLNVPANREICSRVKELTRDFVIPR
jgi:2-dehydropantoate 2-reductase